MIIRKVDASNDWNFGKGKSDYARENDAIAQNVRTRILSCVGDCFFAMNEGIDWKSRLDVGQQQALETDLKKLILDSEDVLGCDQVTAVFDPATRGLSIQYTMDTIYSQNFNDIIQGVVI